MKRPVEDWSKWYVAQGFGDTTDYGFHEAIDLNLRTGGDTDLNQPIVCISGGKLVYYHNGSHPTKGFGRHSVYKIDGAWGTRWVMNSHCNENDFLTGVQDVSEGQLIGRVGKSGTTLAHLHMSIFKVDPATLPSGIDTIAKTQTQLNDWWEDPEAFMDKWINYEVPTNNDLKECLAAHKTLIDENLQLKTDIDKVRAEYRKLQEDSKLNIESANNQAQTQKEGYQNFRAELSDILKTTQDPNTLVGDVKTLVAEADLSSVRGKTIISLEEDIRSKDMTIGKLEGEIERLNLEKLEAIKINDIPTARLIDELVKRLKNIVRRQ